MNRQQAHLSIDILQVLYSIGSYDEAEDYILRCEAQYKPDMEVKQIMWSMQLFNLARQADVDISPWAAVKAIKEAGESGNYASVKDAVNAQETWARAVEIQRSIDPSTGKGR